MNWIPTVTAHPALSDEAFDALASRTGMHPIECSDGRRWLYPSDPERIADGMLRDARTIEEILR